MKFILELDGGGIKGVIPAEICAEIEGFIHQPIYKIFDLISGTSTGSILGSQLAAGVSAEACRNLYVVRGPSVFKARPWYNPFNWLKEKYDRNLVLKEMSVSFVKNSPLRIPDPFMHQLFTKFMCTATSIVDEQTHYFKSWEEKDGKLPVLTAVARSFAAAYYFGAINDSVNKQVWADGGEGLDNCTIRQCLLEGLMQKWLDEGIYILSLGCGYIKPGRPYEEAAKMGWIKESMFYVNLARRQSVTDQIFEVEEVKKAIPIHGNIVLDRLDIEIPERMDKLDGVEYIRDFSGMVLMQLSGKIADVVAKIKGLKGW